MVPGASTEQPVSAGGRASVGEPATRREVAKSDQRRLHPGPDSGRRIGEVDVELIDQTWGPTLSPVETWTDRPVDRR